MSDGMRFEGKGKITEVKDYKGQSGYSCQFVKMQTMRPYKGKDGNIFLDDLEVVVRGVCPFGVGKYVEVKGRVESKQDTSGRSYPSFVVEEMGLALREIRRQDAPKAQPAQQPKPEPKPASTPQAQDAPPADYYDDYCPF